jgi:hypothetical protein
MKIQWKRKIFVFRQGGRCCVALILGRRGSASEAVFSPAHPTFPPASLRLLTVRLGQSSSFALPDHDRAALLRRQGNEWAEEHLRPTDLDCGRAALPRRPNIPIGDAVTNESHAHVRWRSGNSVLPELV